MKVMPAFAAPGPPPGPRFAVPRVVTFCFAGARFSGPAEANVNATGSSWEHVGATLSGPVVAKRVFDQVGKRAGRPVLGGWFVVRGGPEAVLALTVDRVAKARASPLATRFSFSVAGPGPVSVNGSAAEPAGGGRRLPPPACLAPTGSPSGLPRPGDMSR